jgi:DNA-binding GntR family transcriptional regulator
MINQLVMKFKRLRLVSLSQPGRMIVSIEDHHDMIQAFKDHDGSRADSLVRHAATIGADALIQSMTQAETASGKAVSGLKSAVT